MTEFDIEGQRVVVQESGLARGPLAVLIHGWASSSFTWNPLLPALSRRYRCLAIDLPGFGHSPAPHQPPTIAGYAEMVARLIEHESDRAVLLLGHSMGGQIATTLALRYPMLVERMVLLNPAISGRLSTRVNMLFAPHVVLERVPFVERLLAFAARTPIDYTDYLMKPSNFAELATIAPEDYKRIRADARRVGQGRTRAACFSAMKKGDLRGQLGSVETPTLVVWGAEDNIVPLRDAGVVAAEWPKADLRIIPNCGHWPQFEQPDATRRHIAHFLGLPPEKTANAIDQDVSQLEEIVQFLNNSEIAGNLSHTQRLRLASLLQNQAYGSRELVASVNTPGDEMYIVREGTLEVWLSPKVDDGTSPVRLAFMHTGQVVGELSLLDDAPRSADLRAGSAGVTLLVLTREALNALAEDDPALVMRMMQNLAISLGRRLRLQNWQAMRAEQLAHQSGALTRVLADTE
ncbi:MAG TPA: alpha/beta fold hydrolase [Roseiflexaceae bacterium]|nr:alpha/beta fold hydrolase [Roseiflexaceae bacterium]HMP42194.1 alpha/beta fold hydrolase [Roseiflexaceae bacterium]